MDAGTSRESWQAPARVAVAARNGEERRPRGPEVESRDRSKCIAGGDREDAPPGHFGVSYADGKKAQETMQEAGGG